GAAVSHRVQAAAVFHEQRQPRAVQDADPGPRVGLRLPRRHRHRGILRVRAPPQDRHGRATAYPHPARRRVRAAAPDRGAGRRAMTGLRTLSDRTSLRTKLITAVLALVIMALAAIGVTTTVVLRSYLTTRYDTTVQGLFDRASVAPLDIIGGNLPG